MEIEKNESWVHEKKGKENKGKRWMIRHKRTKGGKRVKTKLLNEGEEGSVARTGKGQREWRKKRKRTGWETGVLGMNRRKKRGKNKAVK